MKKIKYVLFIVLMVVLPSEANVLGRAFRVSTVIDLSLLSGGEYITITGFAGGDVQDGQLNFYSSGNVGSNLVDTEVRKYNPASGTIGSILSDSDATQISWSLFSEPELKINDSVILGNKFDMFVDGKLISVAGDHTGKPSSYSHVSWQVKSNDNLSDILEPGDKVEVQSIIMVTVVF
ncbi:hypothetical protein ACPV36_04640 [Photobacterium damselae]|uniref:hypothetical protein n=1 Tax=Photobacterium damselae TaxID=38293 RepID=UPI004067BB97